jgi:transcriptional regulator with XRE-family HTH domain
METVKEKSVEAFHPATIADRFRLQRTSVGMSQTQLAKSLDVFPPYISDIENGKKRPKIEFIARAAKVLGCSVADLAPETFADPDLAPPLVLIRSPSEGILVGRTQADRLLLERLGYSVGVRIGAIPRLIETAAVQKVGISVRMDLPPAMVIPSDDRSDGLGPEYRRLIYQWASSVYGDNITPNAKDVFHRIVVDGQYPVEVAGSLGLTTRTVGQFEFNVRTAYRGLLESEAGQKMAARIVERLARPVGPRPPAPLARAMSAVRERVQ